MVLWFLLLSIICFEVYCHRHHCQPFKSTPSKELVVKKYRRGEVPLYVWMMDRNEFCSLARMESLASRGHPDTNCSHSALDFDVQFSSKGSVPLSYNHDFPLNVTSTFVNEQHPLHNHVCNNFMHVLILRSPMEASVLDFQQFILPTCNLKHITISRCVQEMFEIVRHPRVIVNPIFSRKQLALIKLNILGNRTIQSLTGGGGDIEAAKKVIDKFSLVLDLTSASISSLLIRCVLGWKTLSPPQLHPVESFKPVEQLPQDLLLQWMRHLRYEQQLYDYTLALIHQHHSQALDTMFAT